MKEPFVFACKTKQMFYVEDPRNSNSHMYIDMVKSDWGRNNIIALVTEDIPDINIYLENLLRDIKMLS